MNSSHIPEYEPIALRGSGSFGYVVEAYDRYRDIHVAIKRTHKVGTKLSREYEILSQVKDCKYIVKLLDIFYTSNDDKKVIQNLVFEFVKRSLEKFMEKYKADKKYIPIEKIKKISKELLLGLDYCHKKKIIHRDLKPENILITDDEEVKICDFGSSKSIESYNGAKIKSTPYIVSRYYRAPELLLGKCDYDYKIDIFAAGCIIAELFALEAIFPGVNEGCQIFEYFNVLGMPDKGYFEQFSVPSNFLGYIQKIKNIQKYPLEKIINKDKFYKDDDIKEVCDLLLNMITWNYEERYTAEQCLNHPFLKDVDVDSHSSEKK